MLADRTTFYASLQERLASYKHTAPSYQIGATDGAKILGVSPWDSPWNVWARANGYDMGTPRETEAMTRGQKWEPWLMDQYAARHPDTRDGAELREHRISHPKHDWLVVAPDAGIFDYDAIVEGKTTCQDIDDHWGEDGDRIDDSTSADAASIVPAHYQIQVLLQLACTEAAWCDVIVGYIPTGFPAKWPETRVIKIWAQKKLQAHLVDTIDRWRTKYLVGGEEPDPDASSAMNTVIAQRPAGRQYTEADSNQVDMVVEFRGLDDKIKALKTRKAELSNLIVASAGDSKGLLLPAEMGTEGKPAPKISIQRRAGTVSVNDDVIDHATLLRLLNGGMLRAKSFAKIRAFSPDLAQSLINQGFTRQTRSFAFPRCFNVR